MKRIVFPNKYQVIMEDSFIDSIFDNQVLVKNEFSLISSGTELALYTGTHSELSDPKNMWAKYPLQKAAISISMK